MPDSGPFVSVHSVRYSLSDPNSFSDKTRSVVALLAKNFGILSIDHEGVHYLSHIYDPLLMSSTSSRVPLCGDRRKQKLDQTSHF